MKIQWNADDADDYDKRRVLKICVNHNHQRHLRSIFACWRGRQKIDQDKSIALLP
ncbi:MAG TPA: hypothetical protein VIF37_19490 [Methylobacter sp.]|jgi:hypothetical protein